MKTRALLFELILVGLFKKKYVYIDYFVFKYFKCLCLQCGIAKKNCICQWMQMPFIENEWHQMC